MDITDEYLVPKKVITGHADLEVVNIKLIFNTIKYKKLEEII